MPSTAVVGVGDELLAGVVVNTNAAFLGQRLQHLGLPVVLSVCVGDDEDEIVRVLREVLTKADAVIVTGGLGPTQDDRTREALARLLGVGLVRSDEALAQIRQRFERRGRTMPESNARQADHPEGTTMIANPWGTAPGIRLEVADKVVYSIPGVPRECMELTDQTILPELAERFGTAATIRSRMLHCIGIAESELAERLADLADAPEPRMAYLPGGGSVRLRFVATGAGPEECEERLADAERTVRERLGTAVWGTDDDTMESAVADLLRKRSWTVAVAESCTGGLLGARLAAVPGATDYFRGGVVAYQNDVKARSLGIAPSLIAAAGAVSGEVALEMARGARVALEADVGLSVTCSAGPEGQDTEVGATFIAVAGPSTFGLVRQLRLPGDRSQVREFAATFALNLLRQHALGEPLR